MRSAPALHALLLCLTLLQSHLTTGIPIPGRLAAKEGCSPSGQPRMRVYLAVSSVASVSVRGGVTERQLEMNWYGDVSRPSDVVAVYKHDPSSHASSTPLVMVDPSQHPEGWYRTEVMFQRPSLEELGFHKKCFYWIAYLRNGTMLSKDCLKTQPTWLGDMRKEIGGMTLGDLMIPGTHNSAAWQEYQGVVSENLATKYGICQEEDLLHQLIYGVRYVDLRVGYYKTMPEKFYVVHGMMRLYPFRDVFPLLKTFLNSTKEVILIDIHSFEAGFSTVPSAHADFMALLEEELLHLLVPASVGWGATLDAIWSSGQIILSYNHQAAAGHAHLWGPPGRRWGNINEGAEALESYLEAVMQDAAHHPQLYRDPWVAMAELTPDTFDVIGDKFGGLRNMADMVNRGVTKWFRDRWCHMDCIVATDFFHGNNIVDVTIEINKRKAKYLKTFY